MAKNRSLILLLFGIFSFVLAIGFNAILNGNIAGANTFPLGYEWQIPDWAPAPLVPVDNPMNPAKVELGRHLFYEKRLSITGEFSCASCHQQKRAFTEPKTVAKGATGQHHPRNSMSLTNAGYNSILTWANPYQHQLEFQLLVPLFGEEPVEMGMAGKEQEILEILTKDSRYPKMFSSAFPESENPINLANLAKAIASFERTLISFQSPYDKYRFEGQNNAISESAKRGEILFNSEKLECFHCHGGINFSDSIMHTNLAFKEIAFHNTGLYNIDGKGAYPPENTGLYELTQNPADMGKFKAPTLRNIALTAPYMHDGTIGSLGAVIEHYAAGGRTISKGKYAGVGSTNPLKSNFISGFKITAQEKQDLIAFLESLTDQNFINNPAFSDPNLN